MLVWFGGVVTEPVVPVAVRMLASSAAIVGSIVAVCPLPAAIASRSTVLVPVAVRYVNRPRCASGFRMVRVRVASLGWWRCSKLKK